MKSPSLKTDPNGWLKFQIEHPPQGSLPVEVTPDLARAALEYNTSNRRPSRTKIENYIKAMKEGRWRLTGHAIVFSDDAVLNDGQQRFMACVESGVSFPCDLRFGISREAFAVTDTGKRRSGPDVLHIAGEVDTNTLSSALMLASRWDDGTIPGTLDQGAGGRWSVDNDKILETLEKYPEMVRSVKVGRRVYGETRGFAPGVLTFCHHLFSRHSKKAADEFMEIVETGLGANSKSHPVYQLRHRMSVFRDNPKLRLTKRDQIGLVIKAWNAWRAHKPIELLSFRTKGKTAELMPQPDVFADPVYKKKSLFTGQVVDA